MIRVRYQETDQMGVVYHANYLNWFEVGRTELIRTMGMSYQQIESQGLLLPVIEVDMSFRKPARYDDLISIYTRIISYNHLRLEFAYEIRRRTENEVHESEYAQRAENGKAGFRLEPEGELLVSGGTRHVWLNRDWKPTRIDKAAPELFELLNRQRRADLDV
jgi:acyl-CoA thioester hydrolase